MAVDGQIGRDDLGEFFVVDDRVARGQLGRDERREDRVAGDRAADLERFARTGVGLARPDPAPGGSGPDSGSSNAGPVSGSGVSGTGMPSSAALWQKARLSSPLTSQGNAVIPPRGATQPIVS